jgi:hypothetical protein
LQAYQATIVYVSVGDAKSLEIGTLPKFNEVRIANSGIAEVYFLQGGKLCERPEACTGNGGIHIESPKVRKSLQPLGTHVLQHVTFEKQLSQSLHASKVLERGIGDRNTAKGQLAEARQPF